MSNSPQRASGRPGVWLTASLAALTLVAGVGFAGAAYLGLGPTEASAPVVDPNAPTPLDLAASPASLAVHEALTAAPGDWSRVGVQKASIAAPFPYSCAQTGTIPVISESQDFTVGGAPTKVTLTAHTAGLGAEALDLLNAGAAACKAGSDKITQTPLAGVGAEATALTLTRGGSTAAVVAFRRGDIVGFVASTNGDTAAAAAQTLDQLLAPALESTCVTSAATKADAVRNPFSVTGYDSFDESVTASVDDPGLPKVPTSADYTAHDLAAPIVIPAAVTPHAVPAYPVWPDMPALVAVPTPLTVPAPAAPTSETLLVPAADIDGPGCGWAFTGMTAPTFDTEAGEKAKKTAVTTAEKTLTKAVKSWSKSVTAYWKAYAPKTAEVAVFTAYVDQVRATNVAWDMIAAEWAGYEAINAVYQAELAAQTKFLADQGAAATAYTAALAACDTANSLLAVPAPSPSATPRPTATPSPTPSPTPTAQPVDCQKTVERPAILDQTAPAVRPEPAKPADPRPAA